MRTRPARDALAALALLAASAPWHPSAAQDGACSVCPSAVLASLHTRAAASDAVAEMSTWGCRTARRIACEDAHTQCWVDPLVERVTELNRSVVESVPPAIVGRDGAARAGLPPLSALFAAAMALSIAWSVARTLSVPNNESVIEHVAIQLARAVGAHTVAMLLGVGLALWLFDLSGLASRMAAATGGAIYAITSPDAARCNAADGAGRDTEHWDAVSAHIRATAAQAIDVAAVLISTAITLLPSFQDLTDSFGNLFSGLFTGTWLILLQVLRFVFAAAITVMTFTLVARVVFTLVEASVSLGAVLALSPLIAWGWFWTALRTATVYLFGTIIYTVLLLAIMGLSLGIARTLLAHAYAHYVSHTAYNEDYGGPDPCPKPPAEASSLYRWHQTYLCRLALPEHAGEGATLLEGAHIGKWMPGLLMLIVTLAAALAILGYARAAATELSGAQTPGGMAESLVSRGHSMLSSAASKAGSFIRPR